jgi:hypothetical protein
VLLAADVYVKEDCSLAVHAIPGSFSSTRKFYKRSQGAIVSLSIAYSRSGSKCSDREK